MNKPTIDVRRMRNILADLDENVWVVSDDPDAVEPVQAVFTGPDAEGRARAYAWIRHGITNHKGPTR